MTLATQPQQDKSLLRKRLRAARASIDRAERSNWDSRINGHLLDHALRAQPAMVAAFLAFDGEPDLVPALEQLDQAGVGVALPVVLRQPGRDVIVFRRWSAGSDLSPNRFGIREPVGTLEVPLTEIDIVLLPLVGWDGIGGRLGMGASFYDRALQPLAEVSKPVRLGVGYALQRLDRVPVDPWDVRLHGVLTEEGLLTVPAATGAEAP